MLSACWLIGVPCSIAVISVGAYTVLLQCHNEASRSRSIIMLCIVHYVIKL